MEKPVTSTNPKTVPLTKRIETTKQTNSVEASTVHVLNSLISWNPSDDGRISVAEAAKALDDIDIETRAGEIRRWLNGSVCPRARAIWDLGYALRRRGCPWITGWWLLWACERYRECYRILQHVCTQTAALSSKQFGLLCHMFGSLRPLAERTVFDRNLADRDGYATWSQYVRNRFLDRVTLEAIRNHAEGSWGGGWDDLTTGAPRAIAADLGTVIRREIAKIPWLAYRHIERQIDEAGEAFLSGEEPQMRLECDILIDSAIRLVSAGTEIERATLALCDDLLTKYIDRVCRIRTGYSAAADDRLYGLLSNDYSSLITLVWLDEQIFDDQYEQLLERVDEVAQKIESSAYEHKDTAFESSATARDGDIAFD